MLQGEMCLPISYVLTILKKSSIYPGESVGALCLYGKLHVKCSGPNTHVPHAKKYKIRGTAELDVLYDLSQTQHLGGLWRDHFLSLKIAPKIISNLVFSLFYCTLVRMGPRLIEC